MSLDSCPRRRELTSSGIPASANREVIVWRRVCGVTVLSGTTFSATFLKLFSYVTRGVLQRERCKGLNMVLQVLFVL